MHRCVNHLLVRGARLGTRRATRRRIGAIMTAIAKNPILLTHPLGGSSDILSAWSIRKVTLAEADALLNQAFHEGDRVGDGRTGEQFVFQWERSSRWNHRSCQSRMGGKPAAAQ